MPKLLGKSKVGKDTFVGDHVVIGHPMKSEEKHLAQGHPNKIKGAIVGDNCILKDYGVLYFTNLAAAKFGR